MDHAGVIETDENTGEIEMQASGPEFEQAFVVLYPTPGDREVLERIFGVDQLCLNAEAACRFIDDDPADLVTTAAEVLDRNFRLRHLRLRACEGN